VRTLAKAPDFAFAVVGYRAWQLDPGGILFPLALHGAPPWEAGVNRADCFAQRPHDGEEPPGSRCTCGFHALQDPADRRLTLGQPVVGAIAAWGELEVHATGFRAEYARVVALLYEPGSPAELGGRLRRAARRYGVRLVAVGELVPEALRYALPLPERVLPQ
jgi:hypothetical protein